jgi:hypothetical protein
MLRNYDRVWQPLPGVKMTAPISSIDRSHCHPATVTATATPATATLLTAMQPMPPCHCHPRTAMPCVAHCHSATPAATLPLPHCHCHATATPATAMPLPQPLSLLPHCHCHPATIQTATTPSIHIRFRSFLHPQNRRFKPLPPSHCHPATLPPQPLPHTWIRTALRTRSAKTSPAGTYLRIFFKKFKFYIKIAQKLAKK